MQCHQKHTSSSPTTTKRHCSTCRKSNTTSLTHVPNTTLWYDPVAAYKQTCTKLGHTKTCHQENMSCHQKHTSSSPTTAKQHCSVCRKSNMIALPLMPEIPHAGMSCSLLTSKPAQNLTIPKHTTRKTYRAIKNIPAAAQKTAKQALRHLQSRLKYHTVVWPGRCCQANLQKNLTIPRHEFRKTCRAIKNIPAPAQQLQNKHCSTDKHNHDKTLTQDTSHACIYRWLFLIKKRQLIHTLYKFCLFVCFFLIFFFGGGVGMGALFNMYIPQFLFVALIPRSLMILHPAAVSMINLRLSPLPPPKQLMSGNWGCNSTQGGSRLKKE